MILYLVLFLRFLRFFCVVVRFVSRFFAFCGYMRFLLLSFVVEQMVTERDGGGGGGGGFWCWF